MKRNWFILGTAVFMAALFFTACPNTTEPETGDYVVTKSASSNGTITATPDHGPSGTKVTIRAEPDAGYKLAELKANNTVIPTTGSGPWEITLNEDITLTATFEALLNDQYSVTIANLQNGSITANPQYGKEGATITLTISPRSGYELKAGSLKYTISGSGDFPISGTSFSLPAAYVTISAVFEKKIGEDVGDLIADGTTALANERFDVAIAKFDEAYGKNPNNTEAIVYSSLGRLASIAKDSNVRELISGRAGFTGYPDTIDSLISGDWLEETGEQWTEKLPGLKLPDWFKETGVYSDSLVDVNSGIMQASAWPLLLFANLVHNNQNGLNDLLDNVLSYAFGDDFEDAAGRLENLDDDQAVEVDEDVLIAFGLSGALEGDNIYVGKAELAILFSAVRLCKASLEWVAAYDWNTDIGFLKTDWEKLWDEGGIDSSLSRENLPLGNNFIKDRNNGMMTKSREDFVKAIENALKAYEYLVGSESKLPGAYVAGMEEYRGLKKGLFELKEAIQGGRNFWVKDPWGNEYSNNAANAAFGINMGKLFTPGWFNIDQLIETEGNGTVPIFYALDESRDNSKRIENESDFDSARYVGFKIKFTRIKAVLLPGLEAPFPADDTVVELFPLELGKEIYKLYH
jgi:hypothetical protein